MEAKSKPDVLAVPDSSHKFSETVDGFDSAERNSVTSIIYRVEYRNSTTGKIIYQKITNSLEDSLENSVKDTPFEVVTVYKTASEKQEDEGHLTAAEEPLIRIDIHSKAIQQALRSIITYYPSQELSGDVITVNWPFAVLVHHEDELEKYRQERAITKDQDVCPKDRDAYAHLGILKDFLEARIMAKVREERKRNERGYHTFDMMWVHEKPGATFITKTRLSDHSRGTVIRSLSGGSFSIPTEPWLTTSFDLCYDGRYLGRRTRRIRIERFDGEQEMRKIVNFSARPFDETTCTLIERGKRVIELLHSRCQYYKGMTMKTPAREIDGYVMADMQGYFLGPGRDEMPQLLDMNQDCRTWVTDCTCPVCSRRRAADASKSPLAFQGYDYVGPSEWNSLTDHQYFLCAPEIYAFVFKERTWQCLNVSHLSEPVFEERMIKDLVMRPARLQMLKALAKSYIRVNKEGTKSERPMWTADFVQGKGQGLIFLLHGGPGVGKTCTAECIAHYTKRPLMVLTSSDIGTNAEQIELNLTTSLTRAKIWGAVVLIDEADVFMERRGTENLERNGLVAAFLRALEFYDGILFLTTNRVGKFDDAFMSRMHVQLHYEDLTDDYRKQIWKTFVDKLKKDREGYMRLHREAREYLNGAEIRAVKWNGREIRNAFQTAVALAEYDNEKDDEGIILVQEKHLQAIVEMSNDFKKYLKQTHNMDENKRAAMSFDRASTSMTSV